MLPFLDWLLLGIEPRHGRASERTGPRLGSLLARAFIMDYVIVGADAKTGRERSVQVQAEDEKAALAAAKRQGIFAYRVEQCDELPPRRESQGQGRSAILPTKDSVDSTNDSGTGNSGRSGVVFPFASVVILAAILFGVFALNRQQPVDNRGLYSPSFGAADHISSQSDDPRDRRWRGAEDFIKAAAKETGKSEAEVRRAFNDELDRRGLGGWADGKE